jgi:hypothetical protein
MLTSGRLITMTDLLTFRTGVRCGPAWRYLVVPGLSMFSAVCAAQKGPEKIIPQGNPGLSFRGPLGRIHGERKWICGSSAPNSADVHK